MTHGTLTVTPATGLTVTGNGTPASPLVLTAALNTLNTALGALVYNPTPNYIGPDALVISDVDTSDNLAAQPATVAITVGPTIIAPTSVSTSLNFPLQFTSELTRSALESPVRQPRR